LGTLGMNGSNGPSQAGANNLGLATGALYQFWSHTFLALLMTMSRTGHNENHISIAVQYITLTIQLQLLLNVLYLSVIQTS